MFRTAVKLTAAVVVAGAAVSACGTVQMGAAAITGNSRISNSTLTAQVANLTAAYAADEKKHIKPQRPASEAAQQVLSWLVLFKVYDHLAAQHNIHVTQTDIQREIYRLSNQAKQNNSTLAEYVSAAGAIPPDLTQELARYIAIQSALALQINGGAPPTTAAQQATVQAGVGHAQCVAAKNLGISINPQFGQYDYGTYQVVLKPPTLAAAPGPTPKASPVVTSPHC